MQSGLGNALAFESEISNSTSMRTGATAGGALTIIRAWYTQRQTHGTDSGARQFSRVGRYGRNVLAFAGIPGFLTNLETTQVVQMNPPRNGLHSLTHGGNGRRSDTNSRRYLSRGLCLLKTHPLSTSTSQLSRALPEPLIVKSRSRRRCLQTVLGRHLSRLRGRVFNGRKLNDAGIHSIATCACGTSST